MFNPFRHNAKTHNDLEPSVWQKVQFGSLMVWMSVKSKVSGAFDWLYDKWPGLLLFGFVVAAVACLAFAVVGSYREEVQKQHKLETAPCSEFANYTMQNVPIRCLPSNK